jgi:hypothetical protein
MLFIVTQVYRARVLAGAVTNGLSMRVGGIKALNTLTRLGTIQHNRHHITITDHASSSESPPLPPSNNSIS